MSFMSSRMKWKQIGNSVVTIDFNVFYWDVVDQHQTAFEYEVDGKVVHKSKILSVHFVG